MIQWLKFVNNYFINILNIIEVHDNQKSAKIGFQTNKITSFHGEQCKCRTDFQLIPRLLDYIPLKPEPLAQLSLPLLWWGRKGNSRIQLSIPFPQEKSHKAKKKKESGGISETCYCLKKLTHRSGIKEYPKGSLDWIVEQVVSLFFGNS